MALIGGAGLETKPGESHGMQPCKFRMRFKRAAAASVWRFLLTDRSLSSSSSSLSSPTSSSFLFLPSMPASDAIVALCLTFARELLSTVRMPKIVLVLPVPGGPCTSVIPLILRESKIACRWESLYMLKNWSSMIFGTENTFTSSASADLTPGAACISVPASVASAASSWFNTKSLRGMCGTDFRASNSLTMVCVDNTFVQNQLLF
mmetsp:Transcript_50709/g.107579  ORF Transcript_50709/g.107579 Transcript_50709/m.107579 type:complete len:206 (+) Transcript_50709:1657-2274(+)